MPEWKLDTKIAALVLASTWPLYYVIRYFVPWTEEEVEQPLLLLWLFRSFYIATIWLWLSIAHDTATVWWRQLRRS
jgi:hypothetical protein